jgi:hypothetical protein
MLSFDSSQTVEISPIEINLTRFVPSVDPKWPETREIVDFRMIAGAMQAVASNSDVKVQRLREKVKRMPHELLRSEVKKKGEKKARELWGI